MSIAGLSAPVPADGQDAPALPGSAEEVRLSNEVFRAGLRQRGLTDILELHLKEHPPDNTVESLLAMREIRLAEFADPALSRAERQAAVGEANTILEQLVDAYPKDPRRLDWRFDLVRSLLYDEADPLITTLLYHGGSAAHRRRLQVLTRRAVAVLTDLNNELAREYDRVDQMSIDEYDKLEGDAYIEHIDALGPRADYLMLWALLYDALPRDEKDPVRARRLHEILAKLSANESVLQWPHERTGVRVQTLVLAGMTHRRLHRHRVARDFFFRASAVAHRVKDPQERLRVSWASTLARVESIRNEAEAGRYDAALDQLAEFRRTGRADQGGGFGVRFIAALLERFVYRLRAGAVAPGDEESTARRYRQMAWRAVARLADHEPQRRDEIYATLYESLGRDADPARLDPFEQCALMAGLMFDADRGDDAPRLLDRSIGIGDRFLEHESVNAPSLVAEVLFNTGVGCYRKGRTVDAARRFLRIASEFSSSDNAARAAALAVQIGSESYGDPVLRPHPEVAAVYRESLDTLVTAYNETEAARHWRFYYGQLLEELEEYEQAAVQYAAVRQDHQHYLLSVAARARCLAADVQRLAKLPSPHRVELQRRTNECFTAQRDFLALTTAELNRSMTPERKAIVRRLLARSRLASSEVQVLPHVQRAGDALAALKDFESQFTEERSLLGRVWRVRLIAFEQLGRFDDAAQAVPAYVESDPSSAGPALQTIYRRLADDIEASDVFSERPVAASKPKMALLLAQEIHAWSRRDDTEVTAENRRAISIQLGEANLRAGRFARAREVFEPLLPPDAEKTAADAPKDPGIWIGYSEALYQLGDWASALPHFNRLALTLPTDSAMRWKSLLRDLQCRTRLGHPPEGIIKVIDQQQFLHPEMGGAAITAAFERLARENRGRLDRG